VERKRAGAFYHPDGTQFTCWAPLKNSLDLVLESPVPQVLPMIRQEGGYWETISKTPAGTHYRFSPDKQGPFPDPASLSQPLGVHGPSEVIDRNLFPWNDRHWKGISMQDMIIYELHAGTFSDKQDLEGIRGRLDYLSNLGVNCIELMPVAQFPGKKNWGYDGVFPFAVQNNYGGADQLKSLVNEAHVRNMAVLLDVVYNHFGPEGNYMTFFAPYFTDKYKTFWGNSINFDEAWSDGVREYFLQNAEMWLDEFHLDGLRLDAVHAYRDYSAHHFVKALKERALEVQARTGSQKLLIAETDLNDIRYIQDFEKGGYGLDGQWADEFHHALHALITGERSGYYEDFGTTEHLVKAFNAAYVYDGNYSVHRKRTFGSDARPFSCDHFVAFSQNHDQTGNRLNGDRLSTLISFEAMKLAAATVLLSPYVPLLFMGEEYGEKHPFLFFVDHSRPELLEAVRRGRREEFAYFHHEGEFPDPASEESFLRSMLSWDFTGPQADALLRWYCFLTGFRKTRKAMHGRERSHVQAVSPADRVILLERNFAGDRLLILLNYAADRRDLIAPFSERLLCIQDSGDAAWAGPGARLPPLWEPGQPLHLPACTAGIYAFQ
jgi:maltooligosyltrehalose trehalohydrolase